MVKDIDFATIEKKWQEAWDKKKAFKARDKSEKPTYYVLEMFPYPSGEGLHMGHAWNFTLGDILARYKILQGHNVLHPMGYDALGLPAENAAIKAGTHPEEYTINSMKNFGRQQRALGITYDWNRLLATSEPEYYKWDQWIFLKMFEKGLAYQKESLVNWCPKCNTVLANEQVQNGVCWRHEDTKVQGKQLKQWFFKITEYADELYESIDSLEAWPEKTKTMQKNWIGKKEWIDITYPIEGKKETITVSTTRPDTNFGATFIVISPEHPLLSQEGFIPEEQKEAVQRYCEEAGKKTAEERIEEGREKTGVFTGLHGVNQLNNKKMPLWVADFVLASVGTGVVVGVPGHDKRDFEFAKTFDLPVVRVVVGQDNDHSEITDISQVQEEEGDMVNSEFLDGMDIHKATQAMMDHLEKKGWGKRTFRYRLHDWGISRQRYWGTPIPIIHCEDCGAVPVPEFDLPVELPKEVEFGKGNPLETNEEWLNATCPSCGKNGRRESDTMDTFVNSSWYQLRYCDPNNEEKIFAPAKANYWNPIDTYIGGAEHACMHLIYFRFYTKFLRDLGLLKFDEPATRLLHQGFIYGSDGHKMSKSKGNVIEPLETIKQYGADTLRLFMVSMASPDKDWDWDEQGFNGASKFIKRIFSFSDNFDKKKDGEELITKLHGTIKNVGEYYENFEYRKATIELRELFSQIEEGCSKKTFETFLKLLNPICPHITEELYNRLGNKELISTSTWPKYDKKKLDDDKKTSDINENIMLSIKSVLDKTTKTPHKIYVYVMPFEIDKVSEANIAAKFDAAIEIFSSADKNKIDPANKAKKARPGKPSIYFE